VSSKWSLHSTTNPTTRKTAVPRRCYSRTYFTCTLRCKRRFMSNTIYYRPFSWRMVVLEPFTAEIRLCNLFTTLRTVKAASYSLCGCGTIPTPARWCMVRACLHPFDSGSSPGGVFFLSHHPLLPVKILALTLHCLRHSPQGLPLHQLSLNLSHKCATSYIPSMV
jgi:hypothetical protein